ncbi:RHS repeat-associated core domain-containing protein [Micromonospora sp. NPDC093277]|uniref:RHS repeat-associated core domain-containing protein n=1 Tax=Micromonospora sp. NPDC093277 TaxID=3364291 RepID=UPI003813757F
MKRQWSTKSRATAAAVAAVVGAGGLVVTAAPAAGAPAWQRPAVQSERSVPGRNFAARATPADPAAAAVQRTPASVAWPAAGTAEVAVPSSGAGRVRAGALPVWLGRGAGQPTTKTAAPASARVRVLDRTATDKAGVRGLLLTVSTGEEDGAAPTPATPTAAAARSADDRLAVQVDYSSFRHAYGGDWASRLRLVQLPACALTTPEQVECRTGTPLPTRNAAKEGRLTADVPVAAAEMAVLAATAAPAGSAGDYQATKLSPSSSWDAGGPSGDFTWTYPMDGVPGLGGPEPDLELEYSSGGVDGRTASTNNQSSWVGEGWDLSEGFVERRYKSCSDDVTFTPKPYDLCWETDNAFLAVNGQTVELIKDATTGAWHPRNDDGSKVERLTGASNGDNDGEYWKITTRDGTQYFYGLNRLPGWASGNEVTNSTWTAPVFGNDSGEPCHASTFAASYCDQAWRWNLDYVVDPHGNAMSYFYTTETNYYGRNRTATAGTAYHRGGYLSRIDYGQRSDTMYSAAAPMRVVLGAEERCAAGATCGTGAITKDTAKNWPDVPYDQNCAAGATCTNLYAPTFWTRKRLASVTTKVWVSGTTYRDVDVWTLGYQFREPGDGTSPALWLASVTRTGKVGGSLALPAVTFEGVQLENRVDAEEGIPPMYKWRLTDVYDEFGGHVRVNYSGKECTRSAPPTPDSNTKRCFPGYWIPEGAIEPKLDWFHKYVALQVLEDDVSGVAGIEQTDYEYLGGGAWAYDDNELTPAKYRTWSQWRGFAKVRTTNGAVGGVRSQSEVLFLRGMDGDKTSTGTRSVTVTDSEGVAITDHPALAGFRREEITYNGAGGSVLDGEINDPWTSAPTSTRGSKKAYLVGVTKKRGRLALAAGGWRRTEVQTTYDTYGLPSQVNDLGDTSSTNDDECNRITYARNTAKWLVDFKVREERLSVPCAATPSYPNDVISDVRTFYDGSTTFGTAPTKGDITLTQELASYSNSTPTYAQSTRAEYDIHGRAVANYDALNQKTTTAFTPTTGGPVTSSTVTNPMGHAVTKTLDPAWGQETAVVDANSRRTDITHDPVGRITAVWLSDRSKTRGDTATSKFSYLVGKNAPIVVTTQNIRDDGTYNTRYEFFDGRLRPRQTQKPATDGGRVVTDTFYDSRGLVVKQNGAYWNDQPAGTTLLTVTDNTVPAQTRFVFDGDERETDRITLSYGTEKWRTTTTYGGDRVNVDPPAGDTPTTTITDADGKTVELRQYTGDSPSGTYDATKYTYTPAGEVETVTDPAGNVWRNHHDLRGRKDWEEDPDKGTTKYTYDNADQMLTATDARGVTLAYSYDPLGRKTGEYESSTSGPKRVGWTYDTLTSGVVVKGQLASTTRYVNGNAYTEAVNGYDLRYRSLGSTLTIPSTEGALAGTYRFSTGYTDTGLPLLSTYPAVGGLSAETLRYSYDVDGRLKTAQTGLSTLLSDALYTPYDEATQYTLQAVTGKQLVQTFTYDDATRRLTRALVDRNVSPMHLADVNYTYDASGNVTRIADRPSGGPADTQCFKYDYLHRLTSAWTATDACAAAPSPSVLGGPAPYWQDWTYDKVGNRRTETNYNTTTGAGTKSTSAYPAAGHGPHSLASVTTGSTTNSYDYDATGNTTTRTVSGSSQTLTWDVEGHVATVTEGGKLTEFLYDGDGDRLIRRDPGAITLYLGNTELKLTRSTGQLSATRYYGLGSVTAVRTSTNGLSFEAADRVGTAQLSVGATDLAVTQRRYLPFGEQRGASPNWPTEKGYVGGTVDTSTGLTHLGAREYDPDTGRFISVDPLIDYNDPQQMNGYAYANNTPVTMSDPDGRWRLLPGGHYCDGCGGYNNEDQPKKKKSGSGKKKKKSSGGGSTKHYCDGCDYSRRVNSGSTGGTAHHYCDGCDYQRRAAEARRLAREYAAKRAKAAAERKAREAAMTQGEKWWHSCIAKYGVTSATRCGPNPGDSGPSKYGNHSLFRHIYFSASVCLMVCLSVTYQDSSAVVGLSGGLSSGSDPKALSKLSLLKKATGVANMYGGVSVGYSSALPKDQLGSAGVTAARGLIGANGGAGVRTEGKGYYYYGGYSAGLGWAIQGPTLVSWKVGPNPPKPMGVG